MGNEASVDIFHEGELEEEVGREELESPTSIWDTFKNGYDSIVNTIIRPPRDVYDTSDLGPKEFELFQKSFSRADFELNDEEGRALQCSHWVSSGDDTTEENTCIIYLHSVSGSRVEVIPILASILRSGYSLVAFDFIGSGISDGKYCTLGWNEEKNLRLVFSYLVTNLGYKRFILWGRSMGANSALIFNSSERHLLVSATIPISKENMIVSVVEKKKRSIACFLNANFKKDPGGLRATPPNLIIELSEIGHEIVEIDGCDVRGLEYGKIQSLIQEGGEIFNVKLEYYDRMSLCKKKKSNSFISKIEKYFQDNAKNFTKQTEDQDVEPSPLLIDYKENNLVVGMVVDSAFMDLQTVMYEMVPSDFQVPSFIISTGMALLKSSVRSITGLDLSNLKPGKEVSNLVCPCYFIHAKEDDFIQLRHSNELYEACSASKEQRIVHGIHGSPRDPKVIEDALCFLRQNVGDKTDHAVLEQGPVTIPEAEQELPEWCTILKKRRSLDMGMSGEQSIEIEGDTPRPQFNVKVLGYRRIQNVSGSHIVYTIRVSPCLKPGETLEYEFSWEKAMADLGKEIGDNDVDTVPKPSPRKEADLTPRSGPFYKTRLGFNRSKSQPSSCLSNKSTPNKATDEQCDPKVLQRKSTFKLDIDTVASEVESEVEESYYSPRSMGLFMSWNGFWSKSKSTSNILDSEKVKKELEITVSDSSQSCEGSEQPEKNEKVEPVVQTIQSCEPELGVLRRVEPVEEEGKTPIRTVVDGISQSYDVNRRYHDVKILFSSLSSIKNGLGSEIQSLRSKLAYSTKFGEARLIERKDVLDEALQIIMNCPPLFEAEATKEFLCLPNVIVAKEVSACDATVEKNEDLN